MDSSAFSLDTFLSNPWIIAMSAGVLAGIVVYFLTMIIFSSREKDAYRKKLRAANQNILLSLRPIISEGAKINIDVVHALLKATSRKYGVRLEEVYGMEEIGEELIMEIIDSNFINSQTKENFCTNISQFIKEHEQRYEKEVKLSVLSEEILSKHKTIYITTMSMTLSIAIGMMTAIIAFDKFSSPDAASLGPLLSPEGIGPTFVPLLAAALAALLSLAIYSVRVRILKLRQLDKADADVPPASD